MGALPLKADLTVSVRDPDVNSTAHANAAIWGAMGGVFIRFLSAILLLVCLAAAYGGLRALITPRPPLRGERVDIGGRALRIVCEGPRSDKPLIVMESGIFGFASDWGEVQRALAARGIRSCAYDRAGLGFSDPGPYPRDGVERVLAAAKR